MADNNDNSNNDDMYYTYNSDTGEQEQRYCMIYDKTDFFTIFVQMLLAFFALGSLWFKRLHEIPKRTFSTWFMDVFKQGLGACYAHVMNMVIASVLARDLSSSSGSSEEEEYTATTQLKDQCAWYGMSYLIDTTLGLFLAISFLGLLDWIANERDWVHLKHSGVYVGPDGYKHWVSQVGAWMSILTIVKLIIYVFMRIFSQPLAILGQWLFEPLQGNIRIELLFVMIVFPGLLNVIYFWIADGYLKAKHEHAEAHEQSPSFQLAEKKQALLQDNTDDAQQQQQGAETATSDDAAAVASSRQQSAAASTTTLNQQQLQEQQRSTPPPIV